MSRIFIAALGFFMMAMAPMTLADETCMSPYMAKIVGQEDYVYIWILGMEGVGGEYRTLSIPPCFEPPPCRARNGLVRV